MRRSGWESAPILARDRRRLARRATLRRGCIYPQTADRLIEIFPRESGGLHGVAVDPADRVDVPGAGRASARCWQTPVAGKGCAFGRRADSRDRELLRRAAKRRILRSLPVGDSKGVACSRSNSSAKRMDDGLPRFRLFRAFSRMATPRQRREPTSLLWRCASSRIELTTASRFRRKRENCLPLESLEGGKSGRGAAGAQSPRMDSQASVRL